MGKYSSINSIDKFNPGDRVVLVEIQDNPSPVWPQVDSEYEDIGTVVTTIAEFEHVHVRWDNCMNPCAYFPWQIELYDLYYTNTAKLSKSDPNRSFRLQKKRRSIDRKIDTSKV